MFLSLQRIFAVARKELLHIFRDPMTLFFTLFVPVVQLFMLGFAIDTNVRNVRTVIYDQCGTQESRDLIQRFEKGFLLRGVDIEVTLDANGFSGEGDIGLFGEMLSRFFALYADIHLFNQLTLILQPTGKCLRWNENHSQRIPG